MSKRRHASTLEAIFAQPVRATVRWSDIEALFESLDAEVTEGEGDVLAWLPR